MKVRVSVHGRFHAFEMARGLHSRGLLDSLHTTYPAFAARRLLGPEVRLSTAPLLELRRRLYDRLRLGSKPDMAIAGAFGRFTASGLSGCEADILTGWSSATLEAIPVAHDMGIKVVIERGSTHIAHQTELLAEEYRRHGLTFKATDPGIIERELAEYEQADAIAVLSQSSSRSFIERGIAEDKLIVNPLGVDLGGFTAPERPRSDRRCRILFVGALGLRKGTPGLINAFAAIKNIAELHLVGPIDEDFQSLLGRLPLDNVHIRGAVAGSELPGIYAGADIFCLPSIEEGFGMVVAQAMAAGLPVIVSEAVGAADIIEHGSSGVIVPTGDEPALTEALQGLAGDPQRRRDIGRAARERVDNGYSWDDYIERLIVAYQGLLD